MTVPNPATVQEKIISEINRRLVTGLPLEEGEKFWLNGLRRDAKKLLEIEPVHAHIALAGLSQLEWDEDTSKIHMRCALTLQRSPYTISQQFVLLVNFGYFSEALQLIDEALSPQDGYFLTQYKGMYSTGAFQKLAAYQERAKEMGLDLGKLPTEIVTKAAGILRSEGISDELASRALDVVGEMLREKSLMSAGEAEIDVDDESGHAPTVFITFPLCVGADIASDMTFELYERILNMYPEHSSIFNIGFRSAVIH